MDKYLTKENRSKYGSTATLAVGKHSYTCSGDISEQPPSIGNNLHTLAMYTITEYITPNQPYAGTCISACACVCVCGGGGYSQNHKHFISQKQHENITLMHHLATCSHLVGNYRLTMHSYHLCSTVVLDWLSQNTNALHTYSILNMTYTVHYKPTRRRSWPVVYCCRPVPPRRMPSWNTVEEGDRESLRHCATRLVCGIFFQKAFTKLHISPPTTCPSHSPSLAPPTLPCPTHFSSLAPPTFLALPLPLS